MVIAQKGGGQNRIGHLVASIRKEKKRNGIVGPSKRGKNSIGTLHEYITAGSE